MSKQRVVRFLLLIGFFTVVIFSVILSVKANGTVYIKADGSIDGTDKILRDGNLYTFTENIFNQSIVVEKNNIVIDGAGHSFEGDGMLEGIWLENRYNVTITKMNISNFGEGIKIMGSGSKNNSIIGNNISCNGHETYGNGITLYSGALFTTISENNITDNHVGVFAHMSGNNNISKNSITENKLGVWIISTSNQIVRNDVLNNTKGILVEMGKNSIYYNNFVNNTVQAEIADNLSEINVWDQGTKGNYWSNYNGTGPYLIGKNDQDNYPLTQPIVISEFSSLALLWGFTIIIIFVALFKTMCHSRSDT